MVVFDGEKWVMLFSDDTKLFHKISVLKLDTLSSELICQYAPFVRIVIVLEPNFGISKLLIKLDLTAKFLYHISFTLCFLIYFVLLGKL